MVNEKIHAATGEAYLDCPRCKAPMAKLKKRDVVLDICKQCGGMWADAGELDKLAEIAKEEK